MTFKIITDKAVTKWVMDRVPEEGMTSVDDIGPHVCFGIYREDRDGTCTALAGVVFNWFRSLEYGNDIRVIIAADDPSWCLPGVLRELFAYPFEIAKCQRITAVIRDGNERSLKLCLGLGFRKEGVLRKGYNGKSNAIVLGMLKSECKWLKKRKAGEYEQKRIVRTGSSGSGSDGKRTNGV